MSSCYKETICCSHCNTKQKFTIWQSINVTLDPDLKKSLLSGDLTTLNCKRCGNKTGVDYDFLYHDMDKSLAVWLMREDDPESKEARSTFRGLAETTRIVRTLHELFDKIKIFDDGLDDLGIELLKLYACVKQEIDPDAPFYYDKIDNSSGEKFLTFAIMIGDEFKTLQYPFEYYELAILPQAEKLRSQLDRSALDWARIDRHFVLQATGG